MGNETYQIDYQIEGKKESFTDEICAFCLDKETEFVVVDSSIESSTIKDSLEVSSGYELIGGLDEQIKTIRDLIEVPKKYPELFFQKGKL